MDWPDLVKALEPLGWTEGSDGHRMLHADGGRIYGTFGGRAEVCNWNPWDPPLFEGSFEQVAEYLKGGQNNG